MLLPGITLGWFAVAGLMRLTQSSMLDVLGTEYVKLARIKGLPEVDRRVFVGVVALAMLVIPPGAGAQAPAKVPRIGVLGGGSAVSHAPRDEALRQGLRELGYVEGKTITLEFRHADGKPERLVGLAAELVRLRVDVIVTGGDLATRAARQATQTIPIVVGLTGDLVGPGHVASLARPGGNVTGLTTLSVELAGKRLELLKTAFPRTARVAVLWNPDNAVNASQVRETEVVAPGLGVQLVQAGVRKPDDLDGAFQTVRRERADALISVGDLVLNTQRKRIVDFAARHRLPAMYGNQDYLDAGGLMSYAPNVTDMFRRSATYVDKILKGAKPGDLPIEQPTKLELVINLRTAKALGLALPPTLLQRADRVIE